MQEGRYTAGHDPVTGKPISKNVLGKTQNEVKEKLKKAMETNTKIDVSKAGDYTVGQWVKLWYEAYAKPSIRGITAAYYENYIDQHIIFLQTILRSLKDTMLRFAIPQKLNR